MTDRPIRRLWNDDGTAYTIELYDDNVPMRRQKRARQRDKQKRLKRQKPDK
jgi:hypothetical protein